MSHKGKEEAIGTGRKGEEVMTTEVVVHAKMVLKIRVKANGDFVIEEKKTTVSVNCEDDHVGRQVQAKLNLANKPGLNKKKKK